MTEENSGTMNLDLNLGPLDNSSDDNEPSVVSMNLEDYLDDQVHRDIIRHRSQRWRSLRRQVPIPTETRNLSLELISGNTQQTGEGSIGNNENSTVLDKTLENGNAFIKNEALDKKEDLGKSATDEGSFFDCNICLDLSKDPVVTSCGHLFCWLCIYRWLHHHSDAKECPICKGEVTIKNVTPIYGRGNDNNNNKDPGLDYSSLKIPPRPQACRIESWRQTIERSALNIPMDEMVRRLGSAFDLRREWAQMQSEGEERNDSLLTRVLTSRGLREERRVTPSELSDDVIELADFRPPTREIVRAEEQLVHRRNNLRLSHHTSGINSVGIDASSYFDGILDDDGGLGLGYDGLDSLSRIAAVIHSESQTADNGIEIDPSVFLTTLTSSRRRNNGSRISDVDNGDSRTNRRSRRRRLQ